MTLLSQTSKNVFVGDGATVLFSYTFRIFTDADLLVTIQDTSVTPQTEITLVLTSDYTVTGAGDASGGTITLLLTGQLSSAPSATDNITIQRALPITQPTDYVENDPFPAESHETALDRGRMIDQQLQEELDRAIKLAVNITGVSTVLPTPLADAPIGWNSAADALVNNPSLTNLSQIDSGATPDFIGATGGDGVIRVSGLLSYVDGGDFITIGVTSSLVDHDDTLNFDAAEHFLESSIDHTNILNIGTNSHAVIDVHIANTSNPHIVTITQAVAADGSTDVTGAELETLTDGSNADALHTHAAGAGTFVALSDTPANFTGASLQSVRVNVGETALEFFTPAGGGGATLTQDVNQATHGFSVGNWIYHNGTIYALADASAAATAESIGVVSAVAGANDFTIQFGGRITGLSGLTIGEAHFLSETPGTITATAPSTEDSIIKPVLIADSATTGFIFNMRGIAVTSTQSFFQSFVNADLTAGVLTVTHNLGHKFAIVQVYDQNDDLIQPDDINLVDNNSLTIDLLSFGTITGTFQVVVLDVGTTKSSVASDLSLAGQTAEDFAIFNGTNWEAKGGGELRFVTSVTKNLTDASTTQVITGVGFRPSSVIINVANVSGGQTGSWGYASGTAAQRHKCIFNDDADVTLLRSASGIIVNAYSAVSANQTAVVQSFDSDGFTLDWTKIASPTGTIQLQIFCFR